MLSLECMFLTTTAHICINPVKNLWKILTTKISIRFNSFDNLLFYCLRTIENNRKPMRTMEIIKFCSLNVSATSLLRICEVWIQYLHHFTVISIYFQFNKDLTIKWLFRQHPIHKKPIFSKICMIPRCKGAWIRQIDSHPVGTWRR